MTSHDYKQNEISQELSMGAKILKRSYYLYDIWKRSTINK
jgi:hypothetical protein